LSSIISYIKKYRKYLRVNISDDVPLNMIFDFDALNIAITAFFHVFVALILKW